MALYPPGPSRLAQLPDLAGGQAPDDLMYLVDASLGTNAGDPSDVQSSLNNLFAEITKNITDLTVQFGNGVTGTVSAAGKGKIRYNDTAKSFQVSEDGGAYENLIKGAGANTRVAYWTASDTLSSDSAFLWDSTNDRLLINVSVANGAAPLDILADSGAVAQQWRPNTGTMRAQMILDTGPETFFGTITPHNLHLITNNVQRLSIEDTSGNVGINKAAAIAAQLQVVANSATTKGLIVQSAPSTSVNLVEFYNDSAIRYTFDNSGILTLGLAGASGATGQLTFAVNGQANTQTLRGGTAPAATNTFTWPNADPTAGQVLTASAPAAGVVTLSWTSAGTVSGSGVATRVAFWSGTSTLSSDAAYYWDNTNKRLSVGVGTSPGAPIDVLAESVSAIAQQWRPNTGTMRAAIKLDGGPETFFGTTTAHNLHLITTNVQRLSIEATSGNVGVNKITGIAAQLQVVANSATTKGLIVQSAPSTSVNLVEFYNDSAIRYTFDNSGILTLGLAGASGATGQLTFAVNGQANTQTLRGGTAPAATNTFTWPNADPTAGQVLTASAPAAGIVTLTWTSAGTIGGAGVATRVAFWSGTSTLSSDAAYYWDNTNKRLSVGVGTSPGAPIDVLAESVSAIAQQWRPNTGTMRAAIKLDGGPETFFGTTTAHNLHLITTDVQRLSIEATSGNVGINKITGIAAQLQVVANSATTKGLIVQSAPLTSVNIVEFYNDSAIRYTFDNSGILTLGLAGASGATGQLTFAVNGQANTQTLRGGTAPAATNTFIWPNADPTAGQVLTASAPAAGVVTLNWAAVSGGTTINPTDTLMPYRSSSTVFSDSQLIRLSSAITELRNITTGTTAQSFYIYGTAANNTASAPTEYVRANHNATSTAVHFVAEIATPSTSAVAGINLNITASAAVAGASVAGAAAGGSVTITAGNAARLTSGNADGGGIVLAGGTGIGTGVSGQVNILRNGTAVRPSLTFGTASDNYGIYRGGNAGNAIIAALNGTAEFIFFDANTSFIGIQTSRQFCWGNTSTASADTGLARPSAAVLRTTNGGTGLGSLLVGNSTDSLTGNFTVMSSNAATAAVVTVARLGVNSTGTAAAGFGAALSWSAETSTTNDTQTGLISVFWTTATHASRTSAISFTVVNNATDTEAARIATPQSTPGSPFALSVYDGTAPNVWTAGSFAAKLYLISPTLPAVGVAAHFSATGADAPVWQLLRGRGTNASPTAAQSGDGLGAVEWAGQTSTSTNNFAVGARIRVSATENWSAGNNGCQMIFYTSNNAGTITDRVYIKETGTVRINATAGSYNTTTLLQVGNYSTWNTDVVGAIYSGANGTKGLEIIGTNGQTASLLRIFRDSLTPDLLTLAASGVLSLRAGLNTGTTVARVGGTIHEDVTPVSNSGTGETDLMSYSLPANTLGTDNDYLELEAWGEFTAAASNKTVKMYFGSTVIFNTTALAFGASAWRIKATVVRGSSTTQVAISVFSGNTTLVTTTAQVTSPAETLSGAVTIKCTGQSSAASDEVFQEGFIVRWNPASN